MTSRTTGFETAATDSRRKMRAALYLTTAVAMALPVATHAAGNVTISGVTTVGAAETSISAAAAGQSDLNITFDSTAVISPGASGIDVYANSPGAGDADGAITFVNNGKIGTLNVGNTAVVDSNWFAYAGVGKFDATNTFTGTNNGVITNGLFAGVASTSSTIGGDSTIANSSTGIIFGGIYTDAYGDVSVTNSGVIRSGLNFFNPGYGIHARALQFTNSTETSSGTATIVSNGDVMNAAGTTRYDLLAVSGNAATVEVNAKAGNATADASNPDSDFSSAAAVAAPNATTVTLDETFEIIGGDATVKIGATGDVSSVDALGAQEVKVTVATGGKVGTGGIYADSTYGGENYTYKETVTKVGATTTLYVQARTYDDKTGTTTVDIASGASVGSSGSGDVDAYGEVSAMVTSAGTVADDIYAQADSWTGTENWI